MYEFILEQYVLGFFSEEEVKSFVPLFITQEECDRILKAPYKKVIRYLLDRR